jgi:hypothetical protein
MIVKCLLAHRGALTNQTTLRQQACFVFPKMKTLVKGRFFQDVEDIKKNVTAELNAVPLGAFSVYSAAWRKV